MQRLRYVETLQIYNFIIASIRFTLFDHFDLGSRCEMHTSRDTSVLRFSLEIAASTLSGKASPIRSHEDVYALISAACPQSETPRSLS